MIDPLGTEGQAMYDMAICSSLAVNASVALFSSKEFNSNFKVNGKYFKKELIYKGIRNKRLNVFIKTINYIQSTKNVYKRIKQIKPNVIHFQFLFFPLIDFFLVLFLKKRFPVVFTAHDVRVTTGNIYKALLFRETLKLFDAIIVHSIFAKQEIESYLRNYTGHVKIIPHGNYFPLVRQHDSVENRLCRHDKVAACSKFNILFLGSILPYKGLDILIKAFSIAKRGQSKIHLIIAGSTRGKGFDEYEKLINRLGIEKSVTCVIKFLSDKEVLSHLAVANVIALPYRQCYTPGVAHLAMSCGVPIVASKVDALAHFIEHEKTGYLIESNSVDGWADRIKLLVDSKNELKDIANNCIQKMTKEHDWRIIASKTLEFYKTIAFSKQVNCE